MKFRSYNYDLNFKMKQLGLYTSAATHQLQSNWTTFTVAHP